MVWKFAQGRNIRVIKVKAHTTPADVARSIIPLNMYMGNAIADFIAVRAAAMCQVSEAVANQTFAIDAKVTAILKRITSIAHHLVTNHQRPPPVRTAKAARITVLQRA